MKKPKAGKGRWRLKWDDTVLDMAVKEGLSEKATYEQWLDRIDADDHAGRYVGGTANAMALICSWNSNMSSTAEGEWVGEQTSNGEGRRSQDQDFRALEAIVFEKRFDMTMTYMLTGSLWLL